MRFKFLYDQSDWYMDYAIYNSEGKYVGQVCLDGVVELADYFGIKGITKSESFYLWIEKNKKGEWIYSREADHFIYIDDPNVCFLDDFCYRSSLKSGRYSLYYQVL